MIGMHVIHLESLGALGPLLKKFWLCPLLKQFWDALGTLLEHPWALLKRSWKGCGTPLGRSWNALGRSWNALGRVLDALEPRLRKKARRTPFWQVILRGKIEPKIKKIDVKKTICFQKRFWNDFLDFWLIFSLKFQRFFHRNSNLRWQRGFSENWALASTGARFSGFRRIEIQ